MTQGEQATESSQTGTPSGERKRVVCPLCGHQLFKIASVKNPNLSVFSIEIKCKASGCRKLLEVKYELGDFQVIPQKTVA